MERKSRRVLRFESLEHRVYLSVSGHSIAAARAAHVRAHSTPLTGTIILPMPTGNASEVATHGTGDVHPLGIVNVAGTLPSTPDSGGGALTLNGQRGSVSLVFRIELSRRPRGLPSFHFNVVGGSGSYANASGHGTMSWKFDSQPVLDFKLHGTMRPA